MIDRITESRKRLFDALVPILPPGRVRQYVPAQVVSPMVWIERHVWSPRTEGRATVVTITWSVYVVTDADTDEAQAFTDTVSAQIYDVTVRAAFRPQSARHQSVDIGGMTTTALVVTVDDPVAVSTLCRPEAPTATPLTGDHERTPAHV